MACKKKKYLLVIILLLCCSFLVFSQENGRARESEHISQMLIWEPISYASNYDITIEKRNDSLEWQLVEVHSATENKLEVFLLAGQYRYNIVVYNLLNKAEPSSQWFEFTVHKAIQPKVKDLSPRRVVIPDLNGGRLNVITENTVPDTEFTLTNANGEVLNGTVSGQEEEVLQVHFDESLLEKGVYVFTAINPGGLSDSTKSFRVKGEKKGEMHFSIGYSATNFVPGGSIEPQLITRFLPFGLHLNIDYYPLKGEYGNFGFGASVVSLTLNQQSDDYLVNGRLFPISLEAKYRHRIIEDRLYFIMLLGGGVTYLHDWYVEDSSGVRKDPLRALGISPTAGVSVQLLLGQSFFLEVGCNYYASFFLGDTYLQMLISKASIGIKL